MDFPPLKLPRPLPLPQRPLASPLRLARPAPLAQCLIAVVMFQFLVAILRFVSDSFF
jgi:hypothetical protein